MSDVTDGPEPRVRWDRSASRSTVSTVASATSSTGEVILNFGVRLGADRPDQQQSVSLIRRIVLQPVTAKRLHDMLSRLIAEASANNRTPG